MKTFYRVCILLFLAIGLQVFGLDSSETILRATRIFHNSVTVSWTEIPGSAYYRIFYDESALLDSSDPNPLFDSEDISELSGSISDLTPNTDYTLLVVGYDDMGQKIGKTLPVHVKTYKKPLPFQMSGDPFVFKDTIIELTFSRSVNPGASVLTITNTQTGKPVEIVSISSDQDDLRILVITLKEPLILSIPYEITLNTIIASDGTELPAEEKTPLKIAYNGELPPLTNTDDILADTSEKIETIQNVPAIPPENNGTSLPVNNDFEDGSSHDEPIPPPTLRNGPVPIDKLPQTGLPLFGLILISFTGSTFLLRKKLHKGA